MFSWLTNRQDWSEPSSLGHHLTSLSGISYDWVVLDTACVFFDIILTFSMFTWLINWQDWSGVSILCHRVTSLSGISSDWVLPDNACVFCSFPKIFNVGGTRQSTRQIRGVNLTSPCDVVKWHFISLSDVWQCQRSVSDCLLWLLSLLLIVAVHYHSDRQDRSGVLILRRRLMSSSDIFYH